MTTKQKRNIVKGYIVKLIIVHFNCFNIFSEDCVGLNEGNSLFRGPIMKHLLTWLPVRSPLWFSSRCTGRYNHLMRIAACHTSSGAHGSAAGSSSGNHHAPAFRSFNPGTSPGRLPVIPCGCCLGLGVLSQALVLPPQPKPKAALLSLLCQFFRHLKTCTVLSCFSWMVCCLYLNVGNIYVASATSLLSTLIKLSHPLLCNSWYMSWNYLVRCPRRSAIT